MSGSKNFSHVILIIYCLLIICCQSNCQSMIPEVIGSYMQEWVALKNFSGAILIAQGEDVIITKAYGMANYEHDVPNTLETKFYLASVGKQFTAMAIVHLVQLGKLHFDDTLASFFPDFIRGNDITIFNLLTHTSGIPEYHDTPNSTCDVDVLVMQPHDIEKINARIKNSPLEFEPGSSYKYNDSNYALLGAIVEKVSCKSYEQYLHDTLFEPLGMNDTGLMHSAPLIKRRAQGYDIVDDNMVNAPYFDPTCGLGDGSIYSTVYDLYRWDRALYTDKLISSQLIEKMITPYLYNYGFGWVIQPSHGRRCVWHNGGYSGAKSIICRYIDDDLCIIILSNVCPSPVEQMAEDIAAMIFGRSYAMPCDLVSSIPVDQALCEEYCGYYTGQDVDSGVFRISVHRDRLWLSHNEGPEEELLMSAKDHLFLKKDPSTRILLGRNADGAISNFVQSYPFSSGEKPAVKKLV